MVEISAIFAVKIQGAYHQFLKGKEYWQATSNQRDSKLRVIPHISKIWASTQIPDIPNVKI